LYWEDCEVWRDDMTERFDRLGIDRIAGEFRLYGWASFWSQIVLAIIATVIVLVGAVNVGRSPGSGLGLFLSVAGLVALYGAAYWAFRYPKLGRQLKAPDDVARPSRKETQRVLKKGLLTNLAGLLLIILGAQSVSGALFVKSLQTGAAIFGVVAADSSRFIQPLDLLIVLANTHIITAHFIGLSASLWLLNRISR
jgi:hypothetical protein